MGQSESNRSRHRIPESQRLRILLRSARGRLIDRVSRFASASVGAIAVRNFAQIARTLLVIESARSKALVEEMDRPYARASTGVQGVSLAGRIGAGSGANSMLPDSPVRVCRLTATQHLPTLTGRLSPARDTACRYPLLSAATSLTLGVFALSNLFHPARLRGSDSAFGNVG